MNLTMLSRRSLPLASIAVLLAGKSALAAVADTSLKGFCQINRAKAKPGCAERLRAEFLHFPREVQGCELYQAMADLTDPDIFWSIEIWKDEAAHDAAAETEAMKAIVQRCLALVAAFENVATIRA